MFFRFNTTNRFTALRFLEGEILEMLAEHFSERDLALYDQWHNRVPFKKVKAEFGLPINRMEQIIGDIDQFISERLAPHRLGALLRLRPIYAGSGEANELIRRVEESLASLSARQADGFEQERDEEIEVPKPQKFFGTPIDALNLPTRCFNILHAAGAKTIEETCALSRTQLRHTRSCGETSIAQIEQALRERGLALRTA